MFKIARDGTPFRLTGIHTVAGFGLALCYGLLAWASRSETGPGLILFAWLVTLAFLIYGLAYRSADRLASVTAGTVLLWAMVFRLQGFWGQPLFEDDFYRYLWDGYRFATDGTPYGRAPEAYFNDLGVPATFRSILSQINHPDIPTLYGPTFEYVFLIAHWIAPGQLWPLKLLLIGADLLLVVGLLHLAGPKNTLLYAWNPLVIKEIAFTAHPDGLIPLLLIGAWCLGRHGQRAGAGMLLALAVTAKASAWLLVPFLLLGLGATGVTGFARCYLLLYVPFWLQGAADTAGLQTFARDFEFNSALYALASLWLTPNWARILLAFFLLGGAAGYWFAYLRHSATHELPRGDWLFGSLLLVSPVINPWYLLWLLPFASVYPSLSAWVASAAVLLSYATGLNLESSTLAPYEHPAWVRPVEFGAIGLALIFERFRGHHALDR